MKGWWNDGGSWAIRGLRASLAVSAKELGGFYGMQITSIAANLSRVRAELVACQHVGHCALFFARLNYSARCQILTYLNPYICDAQNVFCRSRVCKIMRRCANYLIHFAYPCGIPTFVIPYDSIQDTWKLM